MKIEAACHDAGIGTRDWRAVSFLNPFLGVGKILESTG
jgi:hypothetical protein